MAHHYFLLWCLKEAFGFTPRFVTGDEGTAELADSCGASRISRTDETVPSSSVWGPTSRIPVTSIGRAMNGIFLPFAERTITRTLPTGRSAVPPPDSSA